MTQHQDQSTKNNEQTQSTNISDSEFVNSIIIALDYAFQKL